MNKNEKQPAPESAQAKGARKQRNQLIVLGGLSLVLVVVLIGQLGGEADHEPAALVDGVAQALAEPAAAEPELEEFVPDVEINPVLSEEPTEDLARDPFAAFWGSETTVEDGEANLAPPTVTLNATMPNGKLPLAILDGQMRFRGDVIQGWTLDEIGERRIVLRAPSQDVFVVEMPLLHGRVDVPAGAFAPPKPSNPSFTGGVSEPSSGSDAVADSQ